MEKAARRKTGSRVPFRRIHLPRANNRNNHNRQRPQRSLKIRSMRVTAWRGCWKCIKRSTLQGARDTCVIQVLRGGSRQYARRSIELRQQLKGPEGLLEGMALYNLTFADLGREDYKRTKHPIRDVRLLMHFVSRA